ncbi:Cj0069 family protein [Bradyrhizobium cajani]|uniref:Cj0069 family protein n=1 Tax=Bradyrhizobium cajani TaxID=1928661 RepID=A0A844T193_9BRAD|nr:Cj0069 family protein [Bradyrhizobium cajani]MCP3370371.1 Cj0069 family protein [Bradyrhizobium cajani]MVT72908.1 Cj0069 family protein [Bradyrhizobium cajani]
MDTERHPSHRHTVAILSRGDAAARREATAQNSRFVRVFEAFAAAGIEARPVIYDESVADAVRDQLLAADGVLVWVDPIHQGKTRAHLDDLLRDVAAQGPWVSAHPDVILKMGVKDVLYRTRRLGWGADTHRYEDAAAFRAEFPSRLRANGPRVLKQNRGNGGQGVWKVEALPDTESVVRVLHAQRGSMPEDVPLEAFIARCEPYFGWGGCIIDQIFQPRLPDGMIRCYMSGSKVAGFGHQRIKALIPPPPEGPDSPEAQPGPRVMHGPDAPQFGALRRSMENEWTPGMMELLDIDEASLPVIWDADFLYGPKDAAGADTYVLCEINASSCFAIPEEAPAAIARTVGRRLRLAQGAHAG